MNEIEKKEIEEMANIIYKRVNTLERFGLTGMEICKKIAEELLKYYQPNLSEDSVVLTRKEYESDLTDQYDIGYEQGSKETVEKFAKKIQDYLNDKVCEEFGDDACDVTYFTIDVDKVISDVFELAEQFSVEIKE